METIADAQIEMNAIVAIRKVATRLRKSSFEYAGYIFKIRDWL